MFKHLVIIALVLLLVQPWEVEGGKGGKKNKKEEKKEEKEEEEEEEEEKHEPEKDIACTESNWEAKCKSECVHKKGHLTTCTYVEGVEERLLLNRLEERNGRGRGKKKAATPKVKCVCRQSPITKYDNEIEKEEEKEEDKKKSFIPAIIFACNTAESKKKCKEECKSDKKTKYVRCGYQTFADLAKFYIPKGKGHVKGAKGCCLCVKAPK